MPSDPQAVLARHTRVGVYLTWACVVDGQPDPCDAVLMARALAESEKRAERLTAALEEYLIGMSYMDGDWTHEHCDEDSGGNHHLDLDWWAKDARAALLEGEPDAR